MAPKSKDNTNNPQQGIPGVPKIKDGTNPATWMLAVTAPAIEAQLKVDFAEIYAKSSLYRLVSYLSRSLSFFC